MDNTCVCCGRIIPEGGHICLACGDYDEMQTFRQHETDKQKKRYFRIVDDCGWTYHIATDNMDMSSANIALLTPHVRSAAEITKEEFERSSE